VPVLLPDPEDVPGPVEDDVVVVVVVVVIVVLVVVVEVVLVVDVGGGGAEVVSVIAGGVVETDDDGGGDATTAGGELTTGVDELVVLGVCAGDSTVGSLSVWLRPPAADVLSPVLGVVVVVVVVLTETDAISVGFAAAALFCAFLALATRATFGSVEPLGGDHELVEWTGAGGT
jgi:hypothetical protein